MGKFQSIIKLYGQRCPAEVIVIQGEEPSLLGRQTALEMNVLKIVFPDIQALLGRDVSDLKMWYPKCFQGVEKLHDYQLQLHIDDDGQPVAQPLCKLPFGVRDAVEQQLTELEQLDIIEQVDDPTQWVSPLVAIPKSSGKVRICTDMHRGIEAVLRECHPIPTIDDILFETNGATVFSKLDLCWGYHHTELYPASRGITTLITHKGQFRYKRLMFGISSGPE